MSRCCPCPAGGLGGEGVKEMGFISSAAVVLYRNNDVNCGIKLSVKVSFRCLTIVTVAESF